MSVSLMANLSKAILLVSSASNIESTVTWFQGPLGSSVCVCVCVCVCVRVCVCVCVLFVLPGLSKISALERPQGK